MEGGINKRVGEKETGLAIPYTRNSPLTAFSVLASLLVILLTVSPSSIPRSMLKRPEWGWLLVRVNLTLGSVLYTTISISRLIQRNIRISKQKELL